jgi:hypothetical protein
MHLATTTRCDELAVFGDFDLRRWGVPDLTTFASLDLGIGECQAASAFYFNAIFHNDVR